VTGGQKLIDTVLCGCYHTRRFAGLGKIACQINNKLTITQTKIMLKTFTLISCLTLTLLSANTASAALLMPRDELMLSITFHTQEIDNVQSGRRYKIVEITLNTIDVLNALAGDLGVTNNNGRLGFPKGSYLVLLGDKITVVSGSNPLVVWDVSAYLQYSLASDVVLGRGISPFITPGGDLEGISYTSLVHIHFEDADHVADFTGFANSQPATLQQGLGSDTVLSASGSGMIDGKPALITAQANLKTAPMLPLNPPPPGPGSIPIFNGSSGK
jgi:hypothetical protein